MVLNMGVHSRLGADRCSVAKLKARPLGPTLTSVKACGVRRRWPDPANRGITARLLGQEDRMDAAETLDQDLEQWIGRSETAEDVVTARMLDHMASTLGRDDPPPRAGDPLPPGWQWMVCASAVGPQDTAADGLSKRGGLLPPIPLPRRMWAGGRMTIHQPLRVGETVRRVTTIKSAVQKVGRSGPIAFVTLAYGYAGANGLAVAEELDVAYRAEAKAGETPPPPTPAPAAAVWRRTVAPDPVLLFKYSALTFNPHRIHYDRPYTTGVEGYPGLLVHGPLIATLLLDLIRRNTDRLLKSLSYRAMRPLYDTAPFELCGAPTADGSGCVVWALDPEGAVAQQIEAEYARY
jgi:3-methylfumaryl-CoA hydratase